MIPQIEDLSKLLNRQGIDTEQHNRVVSALHYFVWAEDRMPDYMPVIGYLDDAYVIATVHKELKREIDKVNKV